MKITIENGKAFVYTPYNPEFVSSLKNSIGGARWNPSEKCWVVNEEDVDFVREIMQDVYGITDIGGKLVNVKVTTCKSLTSLRSPIYIFGKEVCYARGRDTGAKLCAGVKLLEGDIDSTGSRANWYTYIGKDTVLILEGIPEQKVLDWQKEESKEFEAEILTEDSDKKANLRKEKEALLQRLAEINKLLGEEE